MLFLLQVCAFFRIWCVVELVAALLGNVPVILLVGAEDLSVYNAQNSVESEGAPIGSFQPNPAMLDTLVEMVDVDKAVASVEADRVRELGHVKKQLGVTPANFFAKGAILAANHTMRALAASREAREGVEAAGRHRVQHGHDTHSVVGGDDGTLGLAVCGHHAHLLLDVAQLAHAVSLD